MTAQPFDDPDDVDRLVADRHEVDDPHRAFRRLELGLQYERVVAIAPAHRSSAGCGRDQPPAVVLVAEKCGEAGAAVEARRAHPVDRAVVADEHGGLGVPDHGVLLDPRRHAA